MRTGLLNIGGGKKCYREIKQLGSQKTLIISPNDKNKWPHILSAIKHLHHSETGSLCCFFSAGNFCGISSTVTVKFLFAAAVHHKLFKRQSRHLNKTQMNVIFY